MGEQQVDQPKSSVWFKIRIAILAVVLLGVGGVLGYEKFIAKPGFDKSHKKLDDMYLEARGIKPVEGGRPSYTTDDVAKAIGRKPSKTRVEGDGYIKIETYEWLRGTPFQLHWDKDKNFEGVSAFPKYYFEVIYRKPSDDSSEEFFLREVSSKNQFAHKQFDNVAFEDNSDVQLVMPSAPGATGGGGQPAQPADPQQIIDRIMGMDKDEDGKVSKEEATGGVARGFDRIDEDGDGFVTEAEAKKAAENMANRGGGKGKGGKKRPEKDDASDKKVEKKEEKKEDSKEEKKEENKEADEDASDAKKESEKKEEKKDDK